MYAYQVGYHGYEGSREVVVIHEKFFSQDEFEDMVIRAYCLAAFAAEDHSRKEHAAHAEICQKMAEIALEDHDYLNYARNIAEAEIYCPARLWSDSLLDRYDSDVPLDESDDYPHVVDFLVSNFGFARLQYQARASAFDMINFTSNNLSDKSTGFEKKLVDQMRLALDACEDSPNHYHDHDFLKNQRIDEILASLGVSSRAELESRDQANFAIAVSEFFSSPTVEEELFRVFELGEKDDKTNSST